MQPGVALFTNPMLEPLKTHKLNSQHWQQTLKVTLNIVLDGCIVPTQTGTARVDYSHLVVLDNFLDEPTRQHLLDYITEPGWGSNSGGAERAEGPPASKWEQATCDAADAASKPRARTWGLTAAVLQRFAAEDVPAKLEVQSRLCALYPDAVIAHMPSQHIQEGLLQQQQPQQQQQQPPPPPPQQQQQQQQQQKKRHDEQHRQETTQQHVEQQHFEQQQQQQQRQRQHHHHHYHNQHDKQQGDQSKQQQQQQQQDGQHDGRPAAAPVDADCSCFLANAAVYGDCYSWHVDADPSTFPSPSPWTHAFGSYCNREPGRPLLFSLLLYLDEHWPLGHDAETLFLDSMSDTGVLVRPKRFRAVLMDQDVVHRLSAPSAAAGRPRYSLVWKLLMLPKQPGGSCSLARPEWGPPTYFGSAAHVRAAAAAAAAAGGRSRPTAAAPPAAAGGSVVDARESNGKAHVAVGCKRPAAGDAEGASVNI